MRMLHHRGSQAGARLDAGMRAWPGWLKGSRSNTKTIAGTCGSHGSQQHHALRKIASRKKSPGAFLKLTRPPRMLVYRRSSARACRREHKPGRRYHTVGVPGFSRSMRVPHSTICSLSLTSCCWSDDMDGAWPVQPDCSHVNSRSGTCEGRRPLRGSMAPTAFVHKRRSCGVHPHRLRQGRLPGLTRLCGMRRAAVPGLSCASSLEGTVLVLCYRPKTLFSWRHNQKSHTLAKWPHISSQVQASCKPRKKSAGDPCASLCLFDIRVVRAGLGKLALDLASAIPWEVQD